MFKRNQDSGLHKIYTVIIGPTCICCRAFVVVEASARSWARFDFDASDNGQGNYPAAMNAEINYHTENQREHWISQETG